MGPLASRVAGLCVSIVPKGVLEAPMFCQNFHNLLLATVADRPQTPPLYLAPPGERHQTQADPWVLLLSHGQQRPAEPCPFNANSHTKPTVPRDGPAQNARPYLEPPTEAPWRIPWNKGCSLSPSPGSQNLVKEPRLLGLPEAFSCWADGGLSPSWRLASLPLCFLSTDSALLAGHHMNSSACA